MKYSKKELDDRIGKIRGCAEEVRYIASAIKFESGPDGVTSGARVDVKALNDELARMVELKEQIEQLVALGDNGSML